MKILIIAPNWVGDMVMAQVLFKHLTKRYKEDIIIDVIAPKWSIGVLNRMPEVRRKIVLDTKHGELGLNKRYQLGKSLREERYDRAITMPITFKSALVPFFAKIPVRSGFIGEMRFGLIDDIKKLDKTAMPRMIDRYIALDQANAAINYPSLSVDSENQKRLIGKFGISGKCAAFFIGAEYGATKRWSAESYNALAKRLSNYTILLIGSNKDFALATAVKNGNSNVINLCGETTLEEAIDLIALCTFAVCNDSGLMHIAAAVNVPVAAIFGSSTPIYTPPLTDKKIIITHSLKCAPCFKKKCPFGHINCLNNITAEEVYKCISPILT